MALPSLSPERSIAETIGRVETVAWVLLFLAAAALLVASLVGAFVVTSRPIDLPVVASLVAVVGGTLALVGAEVVFE